MIRVNCQVEKKLDDYKNKSSDKYLENLLVRLDSEFYAHSESIFIDFSSTICNV